MRLGSAAQAADRCRGVAKLVKASDFDSDMRRFESFLPCQNLPVLRVPAPRGAVSRRPAFAAG